MLNVVSLWIEKYLTTKPWQNIVFKIVIKETCQTNGQSLQLSALWRPQETVPWGERCVWNRRGKNLTKSWKHYAYGESTIPLFLGKQAIIGFPDCFPASVALQAHSPLQKSDLKLEHLCFHLFILLYSIFASFTYSCQSPLPVVCPFLGHSGHRVALCAPQFTVSMRIDCSFLGSPIAASVVLGGSVAPFPASSFSEFSTGVFVFPGGWVAPASPSSSFL